MIHVRDDVKPLFENEQSFDDFMRIGSDLRRDFKNRQTLRFERDGKGFYIKRHDRVGLMQIIDNLIRLRKPDIGALPEKRAIEKLRELGVPTMSIAAFGLEGRGPGQRSFIITDEISPAISLEDVCRDWPTTPPQADFKRRLINRIARTSQTLHTHGVNHRDYYICHFLLQTQADGSINQRAQPVLHLIDLHRTQIRPATPARWIAKDLAGIYFSSMDAGLTRRDILRFIKIYTGLPLRRALAQEQSLLGMVQRRAVSTYQSQWGKKPTLVIG